MRVNLRMLFEVALSFEQRRENPFVMSIDSIVSDDRVALAATGDAEERTSWAGRVVLTSRRCLCRLGIKHTGHLRNQSGKPPEIVSSGPRGPATACPERAALGQA